jgi:Rab GDP dissociation inhibitor
VLMVSSVHQVCKQGFYVAIISATVETNKPEDELKPALAIIGNVKEKFITVNFLNIK